MNKCFMFPGQGTQKPGMLSLLDDYWEIVEPVFYSASEVTGKDVKSLCLDADEDTLRKTENTQIAVTTMNMAYYTLLRKKGITPDIVMGHSLGQLSALVAAEVIDMSQLFSLVQKRAQLMGNIKTEGVLCTSLGLPYDKVNDMCHFLDPSGKRISIALYNSDSQIVVGGEMPEVAEFEKLCKKAGALKTVFVKVSNAFHTPLMKMMEREFSEYVNEINMNLPTCKLLLNCKGNFATDVNDIKNELINQCCHTVHWCKTVKIACEKEVVFFEVGVGKVLTGILKSIDRSKICYPISNNGQLVTALDYLNNLK